MKSIKYCLYALCLVLCILITFTTCQRTIVSDEIEEYLISNVPLIYPDLLTFPAEETLTSCVINNYTHKSKSTLFYDDVYFYLCCTYTTQQYEEEVSRLKHIGAEYSENVFNYPAYIMLLYDKFYEYAILDDNNQTIVYIHAEVADWKNFSNFPSEYLPSKNINIEVCKYTYD